MTDDRRREHRHPDDFSEYGSLFDDAEPTQNLPPVPRGDSDDDVPPSPGDYSGLADLSEDGYDDAVADDPDASDSISFDDASGPLPHWTEPATGELPRIEARPGAEADELDDDVDVWSSFSSESPIWKDDVQVDPPASEPSGRHGRVTGQQERITGRTERVTGQQ